VSAYADVVTGASGAPAEQPYPHHAFLRVTDLSDVEQEQLRELVSSWSGARFPDHVPIGVLFAPRAAAREARA
jgi:hypothetical protein